ncbi:HEPN domain-containing protein [Natronomonas marina]|jgi:uncharacterized protein (UPF0332 family)|uniref:HEPN domain-containing protein n=1 Tax=Natronomonas marina TaxID=2961939 RepID=UPI0020C95D69|nr:HEPN domain-containing protein [Natronomonas marina]
MTDFADAELRKAREALDDAQKLREADGSTAGVVNRTYFAAFHAAQAVLSVRGTLPDDEDHVPAQFAEDVVIAEETSMEDAQFLNGLRAYRKKADYEHEDVEMDLDAKLVRAERFVEDMEDFC